MKNLLQFRLADERVQFLVSTDRKLARLITCIGDADLEIENDDFRCIVKYIIGQQISDRARETIWQRLCDSCEDLTPIGISNLPDDVLQHVGISGQKVEYIKNLARAISEKEIEFEKFKDCSNREIIDTLITVRGIGRWTAEMYIIFSLGRINVLAKGDGTIRRSIQWMYNLENVPNTKELINYFNKWEGYETIVSAYFWKSIALGLQTTAFDNITCKGR